MYLNFKHTRDNGDATSNYNVEFENGLTIRQLTDIVLRHSPDDWGYITLTDEGCESTDIIEYRDGKIINKDSLFDLVADTAIVELKAQGGYSRMDYYATIYDADAATQDGQNKLSPVAKIAFAMQKTGARLTRFSKIMVSLSGGADSDVMLDLLLKVCPKEKMIFVFFNTGIEYEATLRHLDYLEQKYNIEIIRQRAALPVPLGVKKYGVPFISKDISTKIYSLQCNNFDFAGDGWKSYDELAAKYPSCTSALKWWCNVKDATRFNIEATAYLKEFLIANPPPFKISAKCCVGAKKQPSHIYEKENHFDCKCLGLRKAEGGVRASAYKNCYEYDSTVTTQNMRPIWWFNDTDKDEYIDRYLIILSDCYLVYGMKRTGCAGCPFNSNFENDLLIMQKYEPKLYKAAIAIFGASYEYTRKYREFKKIEQRKKRDGRQRSIFDYIEEGGGCV